MSGRIDLRKQVSLAATPERAFAALVEPGQITRFWPFREVVSSAVVGGPIVFSGEVDGVPFTDHGVNINQAHCRATEDGRAVNTFHASVKDLEQLKTVIRSLARIKGVYSVDRVAAAE